MAADSGVAAIVLAGNGPALHPLTSAALPKALLPVANRPLITFPLRLLEEAGLEDVLVVRAGRAAAGPPRAAAAHQLHPMRCAGVRRRPRGGGGALLGGATLPGPAAH